jgi:hypothetical protein
MDQPKWDGNILVFFKQGDQDIEYGGYRHGEPVAYINPEEWIKNCGTIPIISDNNMDLVAYASLLLPRSELENIKTAININAEKRQLELGTIYVNSKIETIKQEVQDRILLDDTVFSAKVKSDWLAKDVQVLPVEVASVSIKTVIAKDLPVKILDKNAWTSGSKTFGSDGDYLLRSTMYADIGTVNGDMSATQISDITDIPATLSTSFSSYNYSEYGQLYKSTVGPAMDVHLLHVIGGTNATILFDKLYIIADSTVQDTGTVGYFADNLLNGSSGFLIIQNSKFTKNTNAILGCGFILATAYNGATTVTKIFNNMISNVNYWYGIFCYKAGTCLIENCVIENCNTGFYPDIGSSNTLKNVVLINNNTANIGNTGATTYNCATDKSSIGTGTHTSPQVNIVTANEFELIVISATNAYKVKSGGQCATNGAVPSIAENTTGYYGNARPGIDGLYSIGVDELAEVTPSTGIVEHRIMRGVNRGILLGV